MSKVNLGRVTMMPKGTWDSSLAYKRLDIVTNNGVSYIALQDVDANTAITDTTNWMAITPKISMGTVTTVGSSNNASASFSNTSTGELKLNLSVPRGPSGNETIDDNAGEGDTDVVWSADKNYQEITNLKSSTDDLKSQILLIDSIQTDGSFYDAVPCEIGGVNDSGEDISSTTRIRSAKFMNIISGLFITPADGYMVGFHEFLNGDHTWSGWKNTKTELPVGKYLRLLFTTNPADSETANLQTWNNKFVLSENTVGALNADKINKINSYVDLSNCLSTNGKMFDVLECEVGSLSNQGKPTTSTTRIRSGIFSNKMKNLYILPKKGYMFGYHTYLNGTNTWSGWKNYKDELPISNEIRLLFDTNPSGGEQANLTEWNKCFTLISDIEQNILNLEQYGFITACHQGYSETDTVGHNLLNGYTLAKKYGFNYAETDINFTADNILVCAHELTFTDSVSGETVNISEKTFTELQEYNYFGGKIAKFSDVVKTCKLNGLGLIVDQITSSKVNPAMAIIRKYAMQSKIAYQVGTNSSGISSARTICQAILTHDPKAFILLCSTEKTADNDVIALCNELNTVNNKIGLSIDYYTHTTSEIESIQESLSSDINVIVYTIDNPDTYASYVPLVMGITSNKVSFYNKKAFMDIL